MATKDFTTNGGGSQATNLNNDVEEPRFLKGVAISVWQNSGDKNLSNWSRFAFQKWPFKRCGVSTIRGKYNIDKNSDFWNRYRDDILLAKKIGSNTFRLSIEWARIEPERGQFDQEAIQRYTEIFDCLDEHKMVPNVTLHHFTHPHWFEELGAFEKDENIEIFAKWAADAFRFFGNRVKLWATFNEPSCWMFLGYIAGMAPPGHMFHLVKSGRMLLNLLRAHTAAYHAIKALPGGHLAQVGLVSHHISFEPHSPGILHILAKQVAHWMTYWWAWDVIEHFMLTGEFVWKVPIFGTWFTWQDPKGKPPLDWWGINYYSRGIFSWYLTPICRKKEIMTDMYYPIYPQGLYVAIKRGAQLGVPMYITETGIADSKDDRRSIMIDGYFKETLRAIADGYDVRGFYYWTLVDNHEWATGYTMKFGLYAWEPDGSVDRKLKEGSKVLVRYYLTLPDDLAGVRKAAKRGQALLGDDLGIEEQVEGQDWKVYNPQERIETKMKEAALFTAA